MPNKAFQITNRMSCPLSKHEFLKMKEMGTEIASQLLYINTESMKIKN